MEHENICKRVSVQARNKKGQKVITIDKLVEPLDSDISFLLAFITHCLPPIKNWNYLMVHLFLQNRGSLIFTYWSSGEEI
jgi:hypothetical protein